MPVAVLPLWSDAELAFGKQTSLISKDLTVEDYCNCHTHFCIELAEYLRGEQKRLVLNKENLPQYPRRIVKRCV